MGTTNPDLVAPARLVLQFDDSDLPQSTGAGEPLSVEEWQDAIASVVEWLGPLPVTVIATHNTADPAVRSLIRFAHRLECETLLVTDGTGVDGALAASLIGSGLAGMRLLIGGVSDEIQTQTVGNLATDATGAVAAFLGARDELGAKLDVELAIPWVDGVTAELTAIVGWAQQAGVDGFRLVAPYHASKLPADPELLDGVIDAAGGFCRNQPTGVEELHAMVAHQDGAPGLARDRTRRGFKCPVAGQRIVIGRRRNVYSCPFKPAIGELHGDLGGVWAGAADHLNRIADCRRACVHTELAPEPIFG
jgi:hypothetical protein